MHTVTVYTLTPCVQCDATKRALNKRGIEYTEVDITSDEAAREMLKAQGFMGAPVVIAGEQQWCGFRPDRIQAL